MMVSVLLRLCGALPWASFSPFDEMDEDGPGPWQRRFSKWYRWLLDNKLIQVKRMVELFGQ